mgnify:CR=1 FL=1
MRLKKLKTICTSILLSLALAAPAYALADTYSLKSIEMHEAKLKERLGSGWVIKGCYALDKNTGEIYFAPDGEIFITGEVGPDGCYYQTDGKQVNSVTYIRDKYLDAYNSLSSDEELIFDSKQEINLFVFWLQFERAASQGISYIVNQRSDGTVAVKKSELQNLESSIVEDGAYQNAVRQIANSIPHDYSIDKKVNNATVQTANTFVYDMSYEKKSMEEAVQDKKGVCYHYAMLLHSVLSELSIESELVVGYGSQPDTTHVWLKIFNPEDGKWIYRDPTETNTDLQAGLFPANTYEAYLNSYRMINIK